MRATFVAALLIASPAAAQPAPSPGSTAVSAWERYPAYSSPPLVSPPLVAGSVAPPSPDVPKVQKSAVAAPREPSIHWLGVMVDAAVPDGVAGSVVLRPWHWLRIQAGGMHNSISPGLRAGISLVPFYYWITPSLNVEAGHYFAGDATWIARRLTSNRNLDPLFQKVGYDFGNAHLGLELGSPRSLSFFLRAGISYVQTTGRGVQAAIRDPTIQAGDIRLSGVIPSAKLGLLLYFL